MNKQFLLAALAAPLLCSLSVVDAPAGAQGTVIVGGAPMYSSKSIVENAMNSKDHTTLVAAVKAAGLVEMLSGPGPFTVFAPTDEAFAKLPTGTIDTLLKPDNKPTLTKVLALHVVAGKLAASDLAAKIKDGNGKAALKTAEGEILNAEMEGDKLMIVDAKGDKATVTISDVAQSNGVVYVIDTVLVPAT